MAKYGPEALVRAAEECMSRGDWRTAYGYWKEVICQYGAYVSNAQRKYWEMKMEDCDRKK